MVITFQRGYLPEMHRRLRMCLAPLVLTAVALASCTGNDGEDDGNRGGGSIESLLGEIPAAANTEPANLTIVAGNLDRAAELAGVTPFEADTTTDEMLENITLLTGIPRDGKPAIVSMLLPDAVAPRSLSENDEIRDELGWSIVNVNSFIELQSLPYRFAVLRADVAADDIDDAVGASENGIWSLGGADLEQNLRDITPARRLGDSLRMALDDDLLAVSRTTPPIREWLDGADETLADDEALSSIAKALDEADVYSAMLVVGDFSIVAALGGRGSLEQLEQILADSALINPFDALGAGLSVVDDEPLGTFVYRFGSEADAKAAVESVRAVFEDGTSFVSNQPLSDMFEVRSVEANGDVVVATSSFRDARPGVVWQMINARDLPTAHG